MDKVFVLKLINSPAFLAVFSGLGTLLITSIFGLLRAKSDERKAFFEYFFPERIRAYKELLAEYPDIQNQLTAIKLNSPEERPLKILSLSNRVFLLCSKDMVWFDKATRNASLDLCALLRNAASKQDDFEPVDAITDEELNIIFRSYAKFYVILSKSIEISSGVSIINEKMTKLLRPSFFKRLLSFIRRDKSTATKKLEEFINLGGPV